MIIYVYSREVSKNREVDRKKNGKTEPFIGDDDGVNVFICRADSREKNEYLFSKKNVGICTLKRFAFYCSQNPFFIISTVGYNDYYVARIVSDHCTSVLITIV